MSGGRQERQIWRQITDPRLVALACVVAVGCFRARKAKLHRAYDRLLEASLEDLVGKLSKHFSFKLKQGCLVFLVLNQDDRPEDQGVHGDVGDEADALVYECQKRQH